MHISNRLFHSLRLVNTTLFIIILGLCSYMIVSPFLPLLKSQLLKENPQTVVEFESDLTKTFSTGISGLDVTKLKKERPKDNRLIIPQMELNAPIVESENKDILDKGLWRRPKTSNPELGGNTVIVGHRFLYNVNNTKDTFYLLDKLVIGDKFTLFWNQKDYTYEVTEVKVVDKTAIEIENPTTNDQLTLYTCTPVWSAEQRLVIIAKPIKVS
jgi:LPXTG-site transpeptidase (sortase) family protein